MRSPLRITITLVAIFTLCQLGLVAQNKSLSSGTFSFGSGVGYVNSVTDIQIESGSGITQGGNKAYQLHLTPAIGYFPANNFVLGLAMDYLISSSQNDNQDNAAGRDRTSDTKLLFGPYSRLYFPFAGDQALFLGAVFGYGKSDTEITIDGNAQNVNTTLMTFGAGPGYAIFSNRRVSLEAQVKYNYGTSRNLFVVNGDNQSTRTLTTAWDFILGMHFYFNRRSSESVNPE